MTSDGNWAIVAKLPLIVINCHWQSGAVGGIRWQSLAIAGENLAIIATYA
jgi:hypothetical protein